MENRPHAFFAFVLAVTGAGALAAATTEERAPTWALGSSWVSPRGSRRSKARSTACTSGFRSWSEDLTKASPSASKMSGMTKERTGDPVRRHLERSRALGREMERSGAEVVRHLRCAADQLRRLSHSSGR